MKHKQHYLSLAIVAFSVIFSFMWIQGATAQNVSDVQYPVAELGNCESRGACKVYCDKTENMQACIAFAKKNRLMPTKEIEKAEKFIAAGAKGPGGCNGKDECEAFCDSMEHIDECVAFAEKNDLMPARELEEAKKVQSAIQRGVRPPACKDKQSCDTYCSQADHMEECITFAEAAGFMQAEELVEAKKVLGAIKSGIKPPACRGKEECDVYCSEESHFEECIVFAEAAGFMKPEEAEVARKTAGKGPGGCRGKDECEAFCGDPANQDACFSFAKEHGMVKEEDIERMEEGKQQMLQGFNQAPPEVRECLNTALGSELAEKLQNGTAMPSMEIGEKMRECFERMRPQDGQEGFQREEFKEQEGGFRQMQGEGQMPSMGQPMMNIDQMPPEVAQCLRSAAGEDAVEQVRAGTFRPSPEIEEAVRGCFGQYGQRDMQNMAPEGFQMPSVNGQMIPEGVRREEIREPVEGGYPMPMQEVREIRTGPGGCSSPEECNSYCQSHPQECGGQSQMQQPVMQPGTEGQPMYREGTQMIPMERQVLPVDYQQFQPMQGDQMMTPPSYGTTMPPIEVRQQTISGKVMPLLDRMAHSLYRLIGIE